MPGQPAPIRLILPATSANLGPGFDTVGLALALTLTIDACVSETPPNAASNAPTLTIEATGRNADRVSRTSNNMIFETYRDVLEHAGQAVRPLNLRIQNEIPLGMGCGSSAAALLAGVMLANHFGALGWPLAACIDEASRREGHPDNVAACALGGFTVSAVDDAVKDGSRGFPAEAGSVVAATSGADLPWKLFLALPSTSLATERARALLPSAYSRADAVANLQRVALLVAAFAQGRGDLLRIAMQDRLHQPYRMEACPLLPRLLPLAGEPGVLGVALSGAGPSVLVIASADAEHARYVVDEVEAQRRLAILDPLRNFLRDPHAEPSFTDSNQVVDALAAKHGISARTIWRWKAQFDNKGVSGLARKPRTDKNRSKWAAENPELANLAAQVQMGNGKRSEQPVRRAWEAVCDRAQRIGVPAPSYETVRAFLRSPKVPDIHGSARLIARIRAAAGDPNLEVVETAIRSGASQTVIEA